MERDVMDFIIKSSLTAGVQHCWSNVE